MPIVYTVFYSSNYLALVIVVTNICNDNIVDIITMTKKSLYSLEYIHNI